MAKVGIWIGRLASVGALAAWCGWLAWSLRAVTPDAVGVAVLGLQFIAFSAALVVTAGLWVSAGPTPGFARTRSRPTPAPVLMAEALGLDRGLVELNGRPDVGQDDTGEIAWARRGLGVFAGARGWRFDAWRPRVREAAWSVVSTDGLRRMMTVVALVVVLFTGRAPFARPGWGEVGLLAAGVAGLSVAHWLMSGGSLRPGSRLVWSMASVGAGLGDGTSRSGLPIRWVTTMATMVVLNLAVALRGMSDRWTHGLGAMAHDARVAAMSIAFGHVVLGLLALRTLPRPDLGLYGATRRLEESSTRRLALGCTTAVALLGFVVGVLPVDGAS